MRETIAKALSESETVGCGCCADYAVTAEQAERSKEWGIDSSFVVLADEILEALNG